MAISKGIFVGAAIAWATAAAGEPKGVPATTKPERAAAAKSDESGRAVMSKAEAARAPIPVAEVRARGVLGELGEPLGAIVSIVGVAVDGDSLRRKDAAGNWYLRVSRVEKRTLPAPVLLKLTLGRPAKLTANQNLTCIGYETGGYIGIAPRELEYVDPYAAVGWTFETRFVVLKITP